MADQGDLINLKILSPSTEVEGGVHLPNLPASTTIKELRQKIQDAAPSKPATERMRLIYRGRVVANDNDKLVDVFGLETIRESKDQSLHLVLRELPNVSSAPSPVPRSSTAPPNPFRPAPGPPQSPLQTNPFRALPQPRPNSQPQVPQPHHHHRPHPHAHHHHHHHAQHLNPFAQGPSMATMPPHLQQQFAQAIAQQMQAQNPTPNAEGRGNTPTPGDDAQAQQAGARLPVGSGVPNLPPNTSRTIRQEGIGPNGERWTVTWNNTNVTIPVDPTQQPIPPRPFAPPPGFPLPAQRAPSPASGNLPDQMLSRTRVAMDYARQEMDNVRALLQPPGGQPAAMGALAAANPPPWRIEQIRLAVRNLIGGLDNVDRGLASLVADPLMAQNRDFVSLQQSATELRGEAVDFNRMLDRLRESGTSSEARTTQSASSSTSSTSRTVSGTPSASTQTQTPSEFPPELFILSSPQGPVGVLFDQRGTYTTSSMIPTLPFQAFNQQFAANRQLIAGIGQQIAQNTFQIPNQLGNLAPAQAQQPAAGAQPVAERPDNQAQNLNQNQNQNQPAPIAPEQDRVGLIAGHLWLLFKLACFVYFFAGGGGWYRPIMLGVIAGLVYLAQIGVFENQFNMVRRHFEALLPLADRAAQNQNRPNANGQDAPNRQVEPRRNLSPRDAAQRMVNQRQDQRFGWIRETMRSTERAFAIFVASLWPGIGERMVQAQEERVRAERAAEVERQRQEEARRQEEEQRKSEQEANSNKEAQAPNAEVEAEAGPSSDQAGASAKGKEKMVVVEDETGG